MEFEKPVLLIDELIYPKNLKQILKENKGLNVFINNSFVRVLVLCDTNLERLNESSFEVQQMYKQICQYPRTLFVDEDDLQQKFNDIIEQINSGIPEKAFYDWFMNLSFCLNKIKQPIKNDELRKEYNPGSIICEQRFNNGLNTHIVFFSSNGTLLEYPTLDELTKKVERLIKEKSKIIHKPKKINKRKPLDSRLRHECFKRDNYKCKECGATKEEKTLHCDHIVPVSQGGTDELSNLQTLCDDCNLAKSNKCFIGGENGSTKHI